MSRHRWTDAERELVRRQYGRVPTPALAAAIGASAKSVSLVASGQGVSIHPRSANHCWTEEEDDVVRRDYQQTTASAQHIASKLGVSEFQVKSRAYKLGVGKVTDRRRWTSQEERLLAHLVDQGKSLTAIAKRLKRNPNSVKIHTNRCLRLSFRDRYGWYTKREVCEILGMDHKWVQARIDNGTLLARPHFEGDRPQQAGQHPWHIRDLDLKQFIRSHPHELTGRNVDLVAIVDILAGLVAPRDTDTRFTEAAE